MMKEKWRGKREKDGKLVSSYMTFGLLSPTMSIPHSTPLAVHENV
jgi:hypothetical protein